MQNIDNEYKMSLP